jgi:hypothetical protein
MKNSQWFAVGAIGALLMLAPVMRADGVDISVAPISGAAGSSVEVVGTVTNNTSGTVTRSRSLAPTSPWMTQTSF